jgi:hypothetical protein
MLQVCHETAKLELISIENSQPYSWIRKDRYEQINSTGNQGRFANIQPSDNFLHFSRSLSLDGGPLPWRKQASTAAARNCHIVLTVLDEVEFELR